MFEIIKGTIHTTDHHQAKLNLRTDQNMKYIRYDFNWESIKCFYWSGSGLYELLLPSETIFSGCKHPSLVVLWCQSYVIYIGYFYLSQFHEYQYLNIYFGLCMCMMEMTIRYLNGVMSSLKSFIRHYWKTYKINVSIISIICIKRAPPGHLYHQGKLLVGPHNRVLNEGFRGLREVSQSQALLAS